jgi:hypothetical protein
MSKFKVSGPRTVAGVSTGDTVTVEQLGSANIAALIAAGHLVEVDGKKAEPVKVSVEETEETQEQ